MKKKTLTREEMIDALVKSDVERWKYDGPTVEQMLEAVARHGDGEWHGWESYSDEDLKEEYETLTVSLKIVERPVIKIKYKLDDKLPEIKFNN